MKRMRAGVLDSRDRWLCICAVAINFCGELQSGRCAEWNGSCSDSDSDADVPLATLRANIKAARGSTTTKTSTTVTVKKEVVFTTTNGSSAAKTTTTAIKRSIKQESETDSDDDIPISGLAQRKKIKMEASAAPVKREPRATSSSSRTASSSVKKESTSSSKKRAKVRLVDCFVGKSRANMLMRSLLWAEQIQFKQQECTEELYQTLKGQLTQELLCRWWYAIDWPNTAADEEVSRLIASVGALLLVTDSLNRYHRDAMASKSWMVSLEHTFASRCVGFPCISVTFVGLWLIGFRGCVG